MLDTDILPNDIIAKTMRAIVLPEANEQIRLENVQLNVPQCRDNELLIKIEYVGLNPLDAEYAKTGFCHWQYPHILGLDAVGVVVDAAKGIYPTMGTRVMWHASMGEQGVLSEYAKVPNYAVSVVPEGISSEHAAALPCAGMTALISLDKLQITEGDTLLIDGGAGAVGQIAIQFAKQRGADVFTTAAKRNHKLVKSLGADVVFDYQDKKLCQKIRHELGPQGFDAVLDAIGAWLANSLCAQQRMSFMSKLLLEDLAKGDLTVPEVSLVEFNAEHISAALNKQLAGGFTGKQVVKVS